jgi:hypothetical protein
MQRRFVICLHMSDAHEMTLVSVVHDEQRAAILSALSRLVLNSFIMVGLTTTGEREQTSHSSPRECSAQNVLDAVADALSNSKHTLSLCV